VWGVGPRRGVHACVTTQRDELSLWVVVWVAPQVLRPGVSGPISTRSEPSPTLRCSLPVTRGAASHSAPPRPLGTAPALSGRAAEPKAPPPTPRNPCALDKDSVFLVSPVHEPKWRDTSLICQKVRAKPRNASSGLTRQGSGERGREDSRVPRAEARSTPGLNYPLYKIMSVRLSEAFKLRLFSRHGITRRNAALGFSLSVQRRLVSVRIGIRARCPRWRYV
jgi:hypothetical protein